MTSKMEMSFKNFQISGMTFELKKFKTISGHDDSLSYKGELWCDGKHLCDCMNDGWGGETMVSSASKDFDTVNNAVKVNKGLYGLLNVNYSLSSIADILADRLAYMKDIKRYFAKSLVFIKADTIDSLDRESMRIPIKQGRRTVPIAELCQYKNGKEYIMGVTKKYEAQGYMLVNDNI